ncbi:MAG: chemotaxis protein CheX [Vampirovibrio sp.]|nr:chemotaxis protein CheX [Vampirovibrio sp.]
MVSAQQASTLDAELVNIFLHSTMTVVETTTGEPVELIQAIPLQQGRSPGDLSAIIQIVSEKGEGIVILTFPIVLARNLSAKMMGVKPHTVTPEIRTDFVSEIANMIAGFAKQSLGSKSTKPYRLTLPVIVIGASHEVSSRLWTSPGLILEFRAMGQEFSVQVSFTEQGN